MESLHFPQLPNRQDPGTDWVYAMRREMQEILPGLFLGPYAAANKTKLENLKCRGITHIVCIRHQIESYFVRPNFPDVFRYLVLNIADSVTENIIQHFLKVRQFIDECLANGGRVLVHGNGGVSRSAALVTAYIMEKYGLPYRDAVLYVQRKRFCINPNEGFAQQLMEYEPIYKARLTLENGHPSKDKGMFKRKFMEEEDTPESMELSGVS